MPQDQPTPFSVVFCHALVRVAARLVPRARREDWRQEWFAEIWHRWQFFYHAGAWNGREALRLVRNSMGAFADAAWYLVSQESIWNGLRDWARSPLTCLGGLATLLLILAVATSGFPATRQLLAFHSQQKAAGLLFIWRHPVIGGGDRGLPPDVAPAWAMHSQLLQSAAGFSIGRDPVTLPKTAGFSPLVVISEPRLFNVLQTRLLTGTLPKGAGVVLDRRTWVSLFRADPKAIGSRMRIGREFFPVTAVLTEDSHFLTRQPTLYLIKHEIGEPTVMVVARARPGVTESQLDRELTRIAEDSTYYFFRSQLRLRFLESTFLAPLFLFGLAVLLSILMALAACRPRFSRIRYIMRAENRQAAIRRAAFLIAKLSLALSVLFIAGLEWSRSESSLLYGSRDPGSGPLLLWIYIAGAMGVFFWSVADHRARCRVCLRILCFPVRIGCPGCLLLDWSGTELLCSQGHGVLHVPHLAPSWDEQAEHWIALDDSWHDLFAGTK